jgi:hypothetical protein
MDVTAWMVHAVTCMLKWPAFAASSFCLLPGLATSSDARIKLSHAFAKTFAEALSPGIYNCTTSQGDRKGRPYNTTNRPVKLLYGGGRACTLPIIIFFLSIACSDKQCYSKKVVSAQI